MNFLIKCFHWIHSWAGATLALLLILISLTGTLLIWKQEYLQLSIPAARAEFQPTPQALAKIATAVESQFDNNEIYLIEFATEDFPLTKVTLSDDRYAYLDSQGKVILQWVLNERFEEWLFDLHHRLLLDNLGLTLVGCAGLALILLVLTGLISFWPLRQGFKQGLFPKSSAPPHLRRSHRNLGIIMAAPLLLSLITGVILVFPEQSENLLLEPFRGEDYSMDFAEQLDNISGGNSGDWLPSMQRALATFPGSHVRSAQPPNFFSTQRIIGVQQPGEWNPLGLSKVYIDAEGGYMDIRIDSQAQHLSERLYQAGYPLHTGRISNLAYKILLTLSGLLIAILSSIGFTSFIKSKFRALTKNHH